ncbi:MAG: IS21 family transposase [Actinomycetota bacterium]
MLKVMERSVIRHFRQKGKSYEEIGEELGCNRKTVSRAMKEPMDKKYPGKKIVSQVEPYREKIEKWVGDNIPISRMIEMSRNEIPPYIGCSSVFYDYVSKIKKEVKRNGMDVAIRFEGMAGEYLQIDWGEVRNFPFVGKEGETRHIFAARLKYSRIMYVEFCKNTRIETLIRCMLRAFEYIGGVPWCCLFDNMRTITNGRDGDGKVIWNESFGKFAAELEFHRQVCDPYSPNQKGTVENLVKIVKNNFMPGREFLDDIDLGNRNREWLEKINGTKSQAHNMVPFDVLKEEQNKFIPLKTTSDEYGLLKICMVHNDSCIRLESNCYSVPSENYPGSVIVRIGKDIVKIYDRDGKKCIAEHRRLFCKGQRQIEPSHYEEVLKKKPKGRIVLYRDHLISQDAQLCNYISNLCFRRRGVDGYGPDILKMYDLYQKHGKEDFLAAVALCSEWNNYGSEYLEYILEIPNSGKKSFPLSIPGIPTQEDIDREMNGYVQYCKGVRDNG